MNRVSLPKGHFCAGHSFALLYNCVKIFINSLILSLFGLSLDEQLKKPRYGLPKLTVNTSKSFQTDNLTLECQDTGTIRLFAIILSKPLYVNWISRRLTFTSLLNIIGDNLVVPAHGHLRVNLWVSKDLYITDFIQS